MLNTVLVKHRLAFRLPLMALATLTLLFFLPACVGNTRLTEIEKAKLIKEKRKDAQDLLSRFLASGEKDLQLLEKYVKLHQEITEIASSSCPNCWAGYAEALSMLGWYYLESYQDNLDQASTAKGSAARQHQGLADQDRTEYEKYFQLSNNAFETYFRDRSIPYKHPYFYERVMRHFEIFENYDRALYYLQRF